MSVGGKWRGEGSGEARAVSLAADFVRLKVFCSISFLAIIFAV